MGSNCEPRLTDVETILLDAAFEDARWGDAVRAMDDLCRLCGGQFTALAADGSGGVEAAFGACYIRGEPHGP